MPHPFLSRQTAIVAGLSSSPIEKIHIDDRATRSHWRRMAPSSCRMRRMANECMLHHSIPGGTGAEALCLAKSFAEGAVKCLCLNKAFRRARWYVFYELTRTSAGFQASLRIPAWSDTSYEGEVMPKEKRAKKSVAEVFLTDPNVLEQHVINMHRPDGHVMARSKNSVTPVARQGGDTASDEVDDGRFETMVEMFPIREAWAGLQDLLAAPRRPKTVDLVIARCKSPLQWLWELDYPAGSRIFVYDKCDRGLADFQDQTSGLEGVLSLEYHRVPEASDEVMTGECTAYLAHLTKGVQPADFTIFLHDDAPRHIRLPLLSLVLRAMRAGTYEALV
eukprot:s3841_g3.t1